MTTKNTSTKRTVKDIHGNRLTINRVRLVEKDDLFVGEQPWYTLNSDIRRAVSELDSNGHSTVRIHSRNDAGKVVALNVDFGRVSNEYPDQNHYRIGCRFFGEKTFNRILKNATLKTGRKAMSAKAGA